MYGHDKLVVGLACLAMGDTRAVEIAQTCHVALCVQNQILNESSLLAMNIPPPRAKTGTGIVIDDFVSMTIEARSPEEVAQSPSSLPSLLKRLSTSTRTFASSPTMISR